MEKLRFIGILTYPKISLHHLLKCIFDVRKSTLLFLTQLTLSLVNVEGQAKQLEPSKHTLKNPYKTYIVMINIMIYFSIFDSILNWSIKKIIIYKTNPVLHDIFNIIKGFLQIFAHDTLLKCVFKFAPCLHQKSDN